MDEDLDKLAELGFIIDVDYGHIGSGHYGDVYRGTYGQNVKQNYYCFDSKLIYFYLKGRRTLRHEGKASEKCQSGSEIRCQVR
jgi:hypothetical protein